MGKSQNILMSFAYLTDCRHRLDNDLKALRLIHTRIIDTAIMYPHERGPPYRRALKDVYVLVDYYYP
jgi:hypothetical protein